MTPRIVRIDGVNTPPKVPSPRRSAAGSVEAARTSAALAMVELTTIAFAADSFVDMSGLPCRVPHAACRRRT